MKKNTLKVFLSTGTLRAITVRSFHASPRCHSLSFHRCPTELQQPKDKVQPVVVLFGWLLAKSRHLEKYGSMYHQYGADVLTAELEVSEVLRPKKAEETARKILDKLVSPELSERPILVHGFSVGGYLYSQALHQMETNSSYSTVKDRIVGQVFDSPVSFYGIPHGVSNAATKNPALRLLMKTSIQSYLSATAKYTSKIYLSRQELFYNNPVRSPSLFLYSRDDDVADAAICEHAQNLWKNLGMDVTSVCWENSPHVSHFYVHRTEYVDAVNHFAERVLQPALA